MARPSAAAGSMHRYPSTDHAALRAQQRWAELQGRRHTWFAGAYWGWGFHEDGIRSARRVVDALQARAPHPRMARTGEEAA